MESIEQRISIEERAKLTQFGIDPTIINQYQIIILPENINQVSETNDLLDTGDAIFLSKLLKEQGVSCANSYDLGLEVKIYERRSYHLWLGLIWVTDHVALPVLNSVIGRIIGNKIERNLEKNKNTPNKNTPVEIHSEIKISVGDSPIYIKYEGDATTYKKILQGVIDSETIFKK
jgi:hypothetical protein